MSNTGLFDPALTPEGWFDPALTPEGWFDPDFMTPSGPASTPVVGSETFTLAEGASVLDISAQRTDAETFTDATPAIQATLASIVDAWAFTDQPASVAVAAAATDALTQSEGTTAVQATLSAVDAWTLAEALALDASMSRVDSWTFSEVAGV